MIPSLTFPIAYDQMASDEERAFVRAYADDSARTAFGNADRARRDADDAYVAWINAHHHDYETYTDALLALSDTALRAVMAYDVRVGAQTVSPWGSERLNALEALLAHLDDDRLDGSFYYDVDDRCGCLFGALASGVEGDAAERGARLAHSVRLNAFGSQSTYWMSATEQLVARIRPLRRVQWAFDPSDADYDTSTARAERERKAVKDRLVGLLRGVVVAAISELVDPALDVPGCYRPGPASDSSSL